MHYLIASNGASLTLVMSPLLLLLLILLLLIAGPVLLLPPAHRVHCGEYLMMLQLKQSARDMGKCVKQQSGGGDSARARSPLLS